MKKRKTNIKRWALGLMFLGYLFSNYDSFAQRINFSTWTGSSDISIVPVGSTSLNFNQKQSVIIPNSPTISILLTDSQPVAFKIQAPIGFDITVEVDAPTTLNLDGLGSPLPNQQIPFQIRMAYNNQEPSSEMVAKNTAVELPLGFYNVTFPINRRLNGAPGPPPTPISGGETRPKSTAYLFIYGDLGPIGPVLAGRYQGDVTINVFITSND